jgi:integrase
MKTIAKFVDSKPGERVLTCSKNKLPYVMTKEQLISTLVAVNDIRTAMVMYMGCFQGLRIGEMANLKWADIDLLHGEIRVLDAKNPRRFKSGYGKDRIVPINDMFLEVYERWRQMNPKEEYFLPRDNRTGVNTALTVVRNFQERFQVALKKVGLLEVDFYQKNGTARYKYHLHTLRHVCGTNLYRAGMDLYQIKEFLGHEDTETTQIYCELARDDLREASQIAYAYPKSRLGLPQTPEIIVKQDENLRLQKEILEKQIELMKLKNQELLIQNGVRL